MTMRGIAALPALAVLFVSCATGAKPREISPLNGMIYDYENVPVASASIEVDGERKASSDINGRFALAKLAPGSYSIVVRKDGYEAETVKLDYQSPTQILYVKLFSIDQLLALAERSLERRDWQNAELFLDRAAAVSPESTPLRYLLATLHFRRGADDRALDLLKRLVSDEVIDPYIHVFIADIYQYRKRDYPNALLHLERFLSLRYDPDIEKRRDELRRAAEGG